MSEGNQDVSIDDTNENSKRSERKRQREKQRRSDLTSAFEELSDLILKIEPGVLGVEHSKKKKKSTEGSDALGAGMTRLDIVARTVEVVKALHEENEKNKRLLEDVKRSGGQRDDKVLVMVPTLTLVDDQQNTAGRGVAPTQPTAQAYVPRYSYPYHQGQHNLTVPSTSFSPPYFAPAPIGFQGRPNWDSGSPNHLMDSRGMYAPLPRDSHGHQPPPHYYDYSEYPQRRSDSRNSDGHSLASDSSTSHKEI